MRFITSQCPNCNAQLDIDTNHTSAICPYCGTKFMIDDMVQHVRYDNMEEAGYQFEKGRQKAQRENYNKSIQRQTSYNRQPQKSKAPIWLWVLGWIFFFPAPVMILVWRKQCKWSTKTKIIFTSIFWLVMILYTIILGVSAEGTSSDDSVSSTINSETVTVSNDIQVSSDVDESGIAKLNQFFISIPNFETDIKQLEELAKSYDLYSKSKLTGTGGEICKISYEKEVVDLYAKTETKGDYVLIEYDRLNKKMKSISYFNYDKFYEGDWVANSYSVIDYNTPDNSRTTVDSLNDIVNFVPVKSTGNNLLEDLFLQVTPETTKDDVMAYVEQNNLYYITRGAGNESHISYTREIGEKYGEEGTTLVIDFNNDGYLTELLYYDYPVAYKTGTRGYFYSNEYNQEDGYYIGNYNEKSKLDSAQDVISAIQKLR